MGLVSSKCCYCLGSSDTEDELPYTFEPIEGQDNKLDSHSNETSIITQSEEITDEDNDSFSPKHLNQLIEHSRKRFFELLHSDLNTLGFNLALDKQGITVHTKETTMGYVVVGSWNLPFPPKTVIEFMRKTHLRKLWDKNVQEARKVSDVTPEIAVFYQVFKKVMMMTQRDLLVVSQMTQVGDAWADVCSSVESSEFPETKNLIRVQVGLGGYYIEPIQSDEYGNISRCVSISETDFGGKVPKAMLRSFSVKHVPMYAKALVQGIRDYLDNKFEE